MHVTSPILSYTHIRLGDNVFFYLRGNSCDQIVFRRMGDNSAEFSTYNRPIRCSPKYLLKLVSEMPRPHSLGEHQ